MLYEVFSVFATDDDIVFWLHGDDFMWNELPVSDEAIAELGEDF